MTEEKVEATRAPMGMAWAVLVASALCEAVWATALGYSHGFTRLWPTVVFIVAYFASMIGLGRATRVIPISVAYAVWTGIGAALTVGYALITGAEPASIAKVVFIAVIIGAVIGLKLHSPKED